MTIKKLIVKSAITAALCSSLSVNAAIMTDIVMLVDESGSMGSAQANLRNNIGLFASILSAGGVDARYSLVGFGNSAVVPRLLTNFTDPTGFANAAQGLEISGGTEPGYAATAFALNAIDGQTTTLNYRPNALKNIIIFSDENNDTANQLGARVGGQAPTYTMINTLLKANTALFNAVVSSGGACTGTENCYVPLALNNGGQQFNLTQLQSNNAQQVRDFVTAFANAKLKETLDFCEANPQAPQCQPSGVSAPASLALVGFGLVALLRRRFFAS